MLYKTSYYVQRVFPWTNPLIKKDNYSNKSPPRKFPNELRATLHLLRDTGAGRATDLGVIIDTESAISGAVDRPLDGAAWRRQQPSR